MIKMEVSLRQYAEEDLPSDTNNNTAGACVFIDKINLFQIIPNHIDGTHKFPGLEIFGHIATYKKCR